MVLRGRRHPCAQRVLVQPVRAAQPNAENLYAAGFQFIRLRGGVSAHGGHAVREHHGHLFAVKALQHGPRLLKCAGLVGVALCLKALNGRV